jgi:O-antigen/teichoic acid export membrane protein
MRDGALWAYMQTAGVTGLQFISGIILARILDPADFGVFIAATAYTAIFSSQVTFGIPSALVQTKEFSESQAHSSFWLMEAIAVLCTLLVIGLSMVLADAYDDPRYALVMQLMCITFFFLPFVNITNTLLRREMNFKAISKIRIQATLLTLPVGIIFALLGFGPYSLVLSGIAAIAVTTLLLARYKPWCPRPQFSASAMRPLFGYAWRTNVNSSLDTLGERVDNMMIGAMMSSHSLGIYNRGYSLSRLPVEQLGLSLQPLLFGGLARIQDDLAYTRSMYQKAVGSLTLGVFPFILLFIFIAHSFIANVYGEKWLEAALPLQIMAIGAFAFMISITLRALVAAQNLVGREMPLQIARVLITIAVVAIAVPGGLTAIAIGITVREILFMVLLKRMVRNAGLGLTVPMMFYAIAPTLVGCAAGAVSGLATHWLLSPSTPVTSALYLFTMSAGVLGGYALAVVVMGRHWRSHAPLQAAMAMVAGWTKRLPNGQAIARLIHPPVEDNK